MVKCVVVPGGAKLTRKETDALAEWSKGVRRQGPGRHQGDRRRRFDTGVAKFLQPVAAKLIERTRREGGRPARFAADKPKVVHKVLGELRLKMARDLKLPPSTEFAWVWVVNFPLFEYDEEEKRFTSTHHPFTAPLDEDLPKLDSREDRRRSSRSRARRTTSSSTAARSAAAASVSTGWTCSRRSSRCSASTPRRRS